jgi:hypothetical protein
MYLAFCYNVKPRMMNNILFTTKPNKQKNIENAQFRREKWFNIGGNRAIVTRYRLDPQFHCSYLDSRGVPGKTRGNNAGNYLPFISGDVISGDTTSGDSTSVAHTHTITSDDVISGDDTPCRSPSNAKWMVLLYYSPCMISF